MYTYTSIFYCTYQGLRILCNFHDEQYWNWEQKMEYSSQSYTRCSGFRTLKRSYWTRNTISNTSRLEHKLLKYSVRAWVECKLVAKRIVPIFWNINFSEYFCVWTSLFFWAAYVIQIFYFIRRVILPDNYIQFI